MVVLVVVVSGGGGGGGGREFQSTGKKKKKGGHRICKMLQLQSKHFKKPLLLGNHIYKYIIFCTDVFHHKVMFAH